VVFWSPEGGIWRLFYSDMRLLSLFWWDLETLRFLREISITLGGLQLGYLGVSNKKKKKKKVGKTQFFYNN
jgi:hypothetical protein